LSPGRYYFALDFPLVEQAVVGLAQELGEHRLLVVRHLRNLIWSRLWVLIGH
jgi:hypothetical protein